MTDTSAEDITQETGLTTRGTTDLAEWTPRFMLSVDSAVEMVQQKHEFFRRVMRKDEHYGVVPGTGTKPTLLKPGAELLLSSMGLRVLLDDEAPPVVDFAGTATGGEAFIRYQRRCRVIRQTGPGPEDFIVIAQASGTCNSWEKKYRWRESQLICPKCGKPNVRRSKPRDGEDPKQAGWYCWAKTGGCGATFPARDEAITSQSVGQIPNPDIADLDNTILKMADKRAYVAATLLATGCSDIFTQDVGDDGEDATSEPQDGYVPPGQAATTAASEPGPRLRARRTAKVVETTPEAPNGQQAPPAAAAPSPVAQASPPRPIVRNPVRVTREPSIGEANEMAGANIEDTIKATQAEPPPSPDPDPFAPVGPSAEALTDTIRLKHTLIDKTIVLMATRDGLLNLSADDEDRYRMPVLNALDRVAQSTYGRNLDQLSGTEIGHLLARAEKATK